MGRIKLKIDTKLFQSLFRGDTNSNLHIVFLLALCGALYFPYLGSTPFFDKGEPREALAVQDIVQRREWLFPLKQAQAIHKSQSAFQTSEN